MPRVLNAILLTAIVVLAVLNLLTLSKRASAAADAVADSGWQRWLALPEAKQQARVEFYQTLARRPDAGQVLRNAQEFAQLPPTEKERLRALAGLIQETLEEQPPAARRHFFRSTPRARAYLVYRAVVADLPKWIRQLADLRALPGPVDTTEEDPSDG
jgi:hypothetical protein